MFLDSVIEINLFGEAPSQRIASRRDRGDFPSGTRFPDSFSFGFLEEGFLDLGEFLWSMGGEV